MKNIVLHLTIFSLTLFLFFSCSDLESDLTQAPLVSVHGAGVLNPSSNDFHGKLAKNLQWDLKKCQTCHASDYTGGTTNKSCLTCHTGENGPEECNTCHGDFSNPERIAPPRGVNGDTSTTYHGVGAHTSHVYENTLTSNFRCSQCHSFRGLYSQGHFDTDLPAEVTFGILAKTQNVNPIYNYDNYTCASTYCHGNFTFYADSTLAGLKFAYANGTIKGNNKTVTWTKVNQSEASCGSCHGLPPEGHVDFGVSCSTCHSAVVDNNNNIIDKTKHINGVADLGE